jgi:AbiTii
MSLLREIQTEVANADSDLAAVLRKCKILAARLGSEEFGEWLSWELNGYPEGKEVPAYRRLNVNYFANFMNVAWNAPKQPFLWPVLGKDAYDRLNPVEYREGIAKVVALATGGMVPRPDLAFLVQGKMFPDMECVGAWMEIGGNEFLQLLSAVRTKILDFVLEIEKANPNAGEAEPNSHPIPAERLQPLVQNIFHGAIGSFAQNSHDFTQSAKFDLATIDVSRFVSEFRAHLRELNLSPENEKRVDVQLNTIEAQLVDEPNPTIVREAGRTIRNITEGAIGSLVAAATQPQVWAWIHSILASF